MSGRTLICGSRLYDAKPDRRALFDDAVGVDMEPGDGVDIVADLEIPDADLGVFSHVECLSTLEHCRRPWLVAETIQRVLRPGGTLFLTVPFIWRVHGYPSDYWRFTVDGVRELFPLIEWQELGYLHRRYGKRVPGGFEVDGHPALLRTEVIGFGHRA